jgi:hypothetical protein
MSDFLFGKMPATPIQLRILTGTLLAALTALACLALLAPVFRRWMRAHPRPVLWILLPSDVVLCALSGFFLVRASGFRYGALGFVPIVLLAFLIKQLAEGVALSVAGSLASALSTPGKGGSLLWLDALPPLLLLPFYAIMAVMEKRHLQDSMALNLISLPFLLFALAAPVLGLVAGIRASLSLPRWLRAAGASPGAVRLARFAWLQPGAWLLAGLSAALVFAGFIVVTLFEFDFTDRVVAILLLPLFLLQSAGVFLPALAVLRAARKKPAENPPPASASQEPDPPSAP